MIGTFENVLAAFEMLRMVVMRESIERKLQKLVFWTIVNVVCSQRLAIEIKKN